MIRAVPAIAAMAGYALAELDAPGAVSLAQNESAFAPSPKALQAGQKALADAALYPDPDWTALRAAIASVHQIPADQILCGAGSMELIGAIIRAFAGPSDTVLGTEFGYLFAATASQQAGASHLRAPEPSLVVSVDLLLAAVTPDTRIVFLCNPGNPSGTRILNADILRLRDGLRDDILLVVDQAYGEFDDQNPADVLGLVTRGNTVVLRTFSKAYALASARVGWGYFPPAVASETRKLLNPNNITGVSQAMAATAMQDQPHMQGIVRQTAAIAAAFTGRLRASGYEVPDSHTNFVLIRFADGGAAKRADAALRSAGFMLRGMAGYGLPECLRATIGTEAAMDAVATVLEHLEGDTDAP